MLWVVLKKIIKLSKKFPHREAAFKKIKEQLPESTTGICVIFPTGRTIRSDAFTEYSFKEVMQMLLKESLICE